MNYGGLIRDIRKNKGIYQKEIYHDLVSRQYARKIELGENMPNFTLFLNILERLSMTLDEFVYIANNYSMPKKEALNYRINVAYNNKNQDELKDIYSFLATSKEESTHFLRSLSHILYYDLADTAIHEQAYQSDLAYIQKYLFDRDSWYLSEISDYTACFHIFKPTANEQLFQQCLSSLKKYQNYKSYKLMMTNLLTNYLFYLIESKNLQENYFVVEELKKIYSEFLYDDLSSKLRCKFAISCYNYYVDQSSENYEQAYEIIRILGQLEYTDEQKSFERFLKNLRD